MRQQTRIPITNGFRNLRIQKQEKHDLRKTPTEDKTIALGFVEESPRFNRINQGPKIRVHRGTSPPPPDRMCTGINTAANNSKLTVQFSPALYGFPANWYLSVDGCVSDPNEESKDTSLCPCQATCVDVCKIGHNANKPMSKNSSSDNITCIKGYTGGTTAQNPNSSPTWQSNQIGNLARWYYRNDGYFFDKWNNNGDSGPPTSCFCTAPEALSESSSGSILAKVETFPDQYYYKDDNGSLISFYMSFDGTDVNIFLSNGGINVTKVEELPKTIQFGDYNISITPPPSSSSSISYTVALNQSA